MEAVEKDSQFAGLPTEILIAILDYLDRFQLVHLLRVNKRIYGIAQYLLENRKKIRLCSENLTVLVLSPPSMLDYLNLNNEDVSRASLLIHTLIDDAPVKKLQRFWKRVRDRAWTATKSLGNNKKFTLIEAPIHYRKKQFIHAIAADVLLLIVDPQEIDESSEYIKDAVFGCSFMMSARNVIVAVDLHKYPSYQPIGLNKMFLEAKTKLVKLLNRTVGTCYTIVPVDVFKGNNIVPNIASKFTWFSGPSVNQLLVADQLRTNFDDAAYKELCEAPFRLQVTQRHDIYRTGSVVEGRVMSGTLELGEQLRIYPGGLVTEAKNIESYNRYHKKAMPGNQSIDQLIRSDVGSTGEIIGVNVSYITMREIERRFTCVVKSTDTSSVSCTMAFRAQIVVMKSQRFVPHQIYHVFYGTARIKCLLWWIMPQDGKNHDRAERKLKEKGLQRPPKQSLKKAVAILLPLVHYEIETYKPSAFEKNYRGKVMLMEKSDIVGVGRVDRVINVTSPSFYGPNTEYCQQYTTVVDQAASLFNLPTEQKQHELFLEHVTTNEHAKKSALQIKRN